VGTAEKNIGDDEKRCVFGLYEFVGESRIRREGSYSGLGMRDSFRKDAEVERGKSGEVVIAK